MYDDSTFMTYCFIFVLSHDLLDDRLKFCMFSVFDLLSYNIIYALVLLHINIVWDINLPLEFNFDIH